MQDRELIEQHLKEVGEIAASISVAEIEKAIGILFEAWKKGSRIYTCGNGGSASTATHLAADLVKTAASEGKRGLRAECLNDNPPLMTAIINDEGFDNLFYYQLRTKFQEGDVFICLSVHGGAGKDKANLWSQNLLKAIDYARKAGGKTIGFSGFDGGPMKEITDACIVVPVNSTPHVESFHVVLHHLIIFRLKQKIAEYKRD